MERRQISRVLISGSDKANLANLAKNLSNLGIEIISTGGTSKSIKKEKVDVVPVENVTNFPEMMGGRVKTLHPLIFGGILARDSDTEEVEKHSIGLIDMVVCNFVAVKKINNLLISSNYLLKRSTSL